MKPGEIIQCRDEKDLKQMLQDLDLAGFHAVVMDCNSNCIRITAAPDREYLVQAWNPVPGESLQTHCGTLQEAGLIADEYRQHFENVEILQGYPGEWESMRRWTSDPEPF